MAPNSQDTSREAVRIIDSHIHLYASSHISSLSWTADLPRDHPLNRQNSVDEYKSVNRNRPNLLGFVFLETDRKSGLDETQWHDSLDEVDFLMRIAKGVPRHGEGHSPEDANLVLGIVPWAPVPAGQKGMTRYAQAVQRHCGDKWNLIKGFRYLVQDKPPGVMLQPQFVESLQWLGKNGFAFDLGVDARSGGPRQLWEAVEMMNRVYDARDQVTIVINHFCKPNLRLTAREAAGGHPDFTEWKECIEKMASFRSTYMKLSGMFSELAEQDTTHPSGISTLVEHTKPWVDIVFNAFGPARIMFGSDWPVCNVGGPGIQDSWTHWHALVDAILDSQNLTTRDREQVWSGAAMKAYNIQVS